MKITRAKLRQIIKEELSRALVEAPTGAKMQPGYAIDADDVGIGGADHHDAWRYGNPNQGVSITDFVPSIGQVKREIELVADDVLTPDNIALAAAAASAVTTGGTSAALAGSAIAYELMKDDPNPGGVAFAILGAVPNIGWVTKQIKQIDALGDAATASDLARRTKLKGMLDDFSDGVAKRAVAKSPQVLTKTVPSAVRAHGDKLSDALVKIMKQIDRYVEAPAGTTMRVNNRSSLSQVPRPDPHFARALSTLRNPDASLDDLVKSANSLKDHFTRVQGILMPNPSGTPRPMISGPLREWRGFLGNLIGRLEDLI